MSRQEKLEYIIETIWVFRGIKHELVTFAECSDEELDEMIRKFESQ